MKKTILNVAMVAFCTLAMMNLTACSDDDKSNDQEGLKIEGTVQSLFGDDASGSVEDYDCYGMLVPSFTPQMLIEKGFAYADLLNVTLGDSVEVKNVPFVTGFNEVGVLETCFCDYNAKNTTYGFGQLHGNFKERIFNKVGAKIVVTLAQKQGYKDTWEIMKSVYDSERDKYLEESDEEFANFRAVTTTGMGKNVLYRSSNPLNPKDNPVRFAYVDSLARHYGIKTEIDLADTNDKIAEYRTRDDFTSTYCPGLVDSKQVIALGLTADTYGETFMKTLGNGLKFMLNHEPPYLLHCNEGKDRCGFVSMLLEALAGATYQEVADDYMQTLINFYRIKKGDDSYNMRQKISIDRLVWLLENVKNVEDFGNIDWTGKDPAAVKLQEAAIQYVKDCGLTEAQCLQLMAKLQGK